MAGLKEKSQRPHRSPNATPEDVIRKTEESRRMEGSGDHAVAGGEAVRQGGRGKPQPWRAGAAAVRQGGRGGGARHGAPHGLLWNSIAGANGQWRGVHQSLHFAPACQLQRVAPNGMSLAECLKASYAVRKRETRVLCGSIELLLTGQALATDSELARSTDPGRGQRRGHCRL
jgi:hypothetical protein